MKKVISIGFTNKVKYIEDDKFVIVKTHNGFNHLLDYHETQVFDFVPRLYKDSYEAQSWEVIEGQMMEKWTDSELEKFGKILRTIHKSDIKLPENNFRKRVNSYLKDIHAKKVHVPVIEEVYHEMNRVMTNMSHVNPCHNDVWYENILKTPNQKIFLVDWEYATMGDKHFDLAFFIESCRLSEAQEAVFLKAYTALDNFEEVYDQHLLPKYKRFVYYLTLCWAYAQEEMPFEVSFMEKYLEKTNPKNKKQS